MAGPAPHGTKQPRSVSPSARHPSAVALTWSPVQLLLSKLVLLRQIHKSTAEGRAQTQAKRYCTLTFLSYFCNALTVSTSKLSFSSFPAKSSSPVSVFTCRMVLPGAKMTGRWM